MKSLAKIKWGRMFALPLWVVVSFGISNFIIAGTFMALKAVGFQPATVNPVLLNTILAAVIYTLSLAIVVSVPWLLKKHSTGKNELGLQRLPTWADIGLAPMGFIVYFLLTALVLYIVTLLVPGFDGNQAQELGFTHLKAGHELLLAFFTLVIIAPIAEEVLFRGYLYGKLRKSAPAWLAILITSILFGALHGQWNVGLDVFSLSVILCILREITGSIWAGIILHMLKNGIAFYLLFVNPTLLRIIGG